jgi:hypothetical protein
MKNKLTAILLLALLAAGFTACTTSRTGCYSSTKMVGYK